MHTIACMPMLHGVDACQASNAWHDVYKLDRCASDAHMQSYKVWIGTVTQLSYVRSRLGTIKEAACFYINLVSLIIEAGLHSFCQDASMFKLLQSIYTLRYKRMD
jgi:hypothetical protein